MKREIGESGMFWEGTRQELSRMLDENPLGEAIKRRLPEGSRQPEIRGGYGSIYAAVVISSLSVGAFSQAASMFAANGEYALAAVSLGWGAIQVAVARRAFFNFDNYL